MKNRLITNSLRTIKKNKARFFSLLVITILATFTYTGINSTYSDFKKSIDKLSGGQKQRVSLAILLINIMILIIIMILNYKAIKVCRLMMWNI